MKGQKTSTLCTTHKNSFACHFQLSVTKQVVAYEMLLQRSLYRGYFTCGNSLSSWLMSLSTPRNRLRLLLHGIALFYVM